MAEVRLDVEQLIARAGFEKLDGIIGKALALYKSKHIPLNHILAEVLIAHYLYNVKKYECVDIERSVNGMRCDVYGRTNGRVHCVEVEYLFTPPSYILSPFEYVVARHIKKLVLAAKAGIDFVSFAYPKYVVPPIPLELLRPPASRSIEEIKRIVSTVRSIVPLDYDDVEKLIGMPIHSILFFDLSTGKVYECIPQVVEVMVTQYEAFFV